ncbi:MAG: hypothetical protein JRN33_06575 [Nitrososphaerota archaeon]|jgi:hypothetical protein|nr:hypothetical protein [Nitrososphaerota archaeon]
MKRGFFLPSLLLFVFDLVLYVALLVAAPRFASIPIAMSGVGAPSFVAAAMWAVLQGRRAAVAGEALRAPGKKTEYAVEDGQ